jgi:S-formylglutathione hydrolase FrmB
MNQVRRLTRLNAGFSRMTASRLQRGPAVGLQGPASTGARIRLAQASPLVLQPAASQYRIRDADHQHGDHSWPNWDPADRNSYTRRRQGPFDLERDGSGTSSA